MQGTWIKASERQPEHEDDVLICFKGWDDMQFCAVAFYDTMHRKFVNNYDFVEDVTHWQPLPELPK